MILLADNTVSVNSQTSASLQINGGAFPNLGTAIRSQVFLFVNSVLQGIVLPGPVPVPPPVPIPTPPTTLRTLLLSLVNEQVQITTPFDTLTGSLIAVRTDYVVLVEGDGSLVFVRIAKIESVVEL